MSALENKTALVTGASRGIGRAIAIRLGEAGAHVACGFVSRESEAIATAEAIGDAYACRLDVREPASIRNAVDSLLKRAGTIDVLVCAHGISRDALFAVAEDRDLAEVIDANLLGAMRCARAVVRPMMAAGGGAIINVASVAGLRASVGQAGYAASKGGLIALTKTLAAELAPKRVRVNAVVPGLIDAGMVKRMNRRHRDERAQHIPMGRLGEAREVADAALFLASDAASYVTGQALVVDGGLSL